MNLNFIVEVFEAITQDENGIMDLVMREFSNKDAGLNTGTAEEPVDE